MRLSRLLVSTALFTVALALTVAPCVAGDDGAAMRLYRDPATGAVGVPPPAGQRQPARAAAAVAPAAAAAAHEEPVQAPAGGMRVGLDGRFRAAVTRQAGTGGLHECVQSSGSARE